MRPNQLTAKTIILVIAGIISTFSSYSQSNKTKVSLQKSSRQSTTITIDIPAPTPVAVATPRGDASIYLVDGAVNILEKGAPNLPKVTRSVIVPTNTVAQVKIVSSKYTELDNVSIAPSKGNLTRDIDPAKVPFTYGEKYERDEFYPNKIAELSKPYTLRQYEGVSVNLYPLQYNPISKKLRVYSSVTVEVTYTESGATNASPKLATRDEGFGEVYKSQFLNYSTENLRYTPLSDEGTMLVVCHPAFMSAMQPFVDWKNQRGIKTEMVDYTKVAASADALKAYVSNYYHQNGLTFLLLVGDAAQIPAKELSKGNSDSFYGFIDGDDAYPEVIVGRFSAETETHVTTMVNRTIAYEKNLGERTSWLEKAMGIASDEGGNGQGDNGEADTVHMENIRAKLLTYGYKSVSKVYDPGASRATVAQEINYGVGLINYVGHGANDHWVTTGFGNTDIASLTNNDRWPFIFDVACVNGDFVGNTCFAEAFTRAGTASNPTGTVDIVASTINQSWEPPMAGQDNMVDILTESDQNNIRRTFGGIVANGCMGMNDKYGADGAEMTSFWTIFGDPSLMVRTKTASASTISHKDSLLLGEDNLDVSCNTNNATATLWQEGKILASRRTGNGYAYLTFSALTSQAPVILTITGHNLITHVDTIPVGLATKPYLVVSSITPTGNLIPKTEESLSLTVKNLSSNPMQVTDVVVKLRCSDSRITLIDSTETISSVGTEPITLPNGYKLMVNTSLPDLSSIKFTAFITGKVGTESYSDTVTYRMIVTEPDIKITEITIEDQIGNNNGNVDPGEVGYITLTLCNKGHAIATSPSIFAKTTDPKLLEILSAAIQLESLNPNSSKTITLQYSAPSTGTAGQKVYINMTAVCANTIQSADSISLVVGASNYITMHNGTVSACSKKFFDTGGIDNNYKSSESYTLTIAASDPTLRVKLKFNSFETNSYDNLSIYDGPNTNASKLGTYSGSKTPFEVVSSSAYLTVQFQSSLSTTGKGWDADILCVAPISAPQCPTTLSPLNGATNQRIPQLSWNGSNADEYTIYYSTEASPSFYSRTTDQKIAVPFSPNTTYYWMVNAKNQAGESSSCPVHSFTTAATQDSLLMQNGSAITCNGRFFDKGGPNGNYSNLSRETFTIFPSKPGAMLTANFTQLVVELNYDTLYVWDGPDTKSTLIGAFNAETVPAQLQNLVANNPSGALTFQLFADEAIAKAGWISNIGCSLPSNTSEVTLTVTDGVAPITTATLSIGKIVYHSNAAGEIKLTLPYGSYTAGIEKEGYASTQIELSVSESTTSKSIALEQKRTATITVTNSESGAAVYPANVTINGSNYATNMKGKAIAVIGNATTEWSISASGFASKSGTAATSATNNDIAVELTPLHHIKIRLINAITEQPIMGGQVTVGLQKAYSASDGYTHFITTTGTYAVSANAPGYIAKPEENMNLSSNETTIALTPTQHTVTIWVKESGNNRGVANAIVTVNATTYNTDSEGKVTATLYAGSYTYTVSIANYATYQGSFSIAAEDISITATIVKTGIEQETLSTLSIYPNPANEQITIVWDSASRGILTVTNVTGMQVMVTEVTSGDQINVSNLKPGVYFANIVIEEKNRTVKLIIQ